MVFFRFLNGFTHTGKALEYVRTDLINNINTGARADAEKVIFLFTTGRNSENSLNPLKPAFKLKQKGVKIFVIYLLGQSRFSAYRHRVHFRYRTGHRRQFYVLRKIASGSRYLLSGRSYNSFYRVRSLLRLGKKTFSVFETNVELIKQRRFDRFRWMFLVQTFGQF